MPKDPLERAIDKTFRTPKPKRCNVCGSPEGYAPDGTRVRMINVGRNQWACNYCNNQRPGA